VPADPQPAQLETLTSGVEVQLQWITTRDGTGTYPI
jgi:hypothetical protein